MRSHDRCMSPEMVWEHTEPSKKCKTSWSNVGYRAEGPKPHLNYTRNWDLINPRTLKVGFRRNWSDDEFTFLIQKQSLLYFLQASVFPHSQRGRAGESQFSIFTVSFKGSRHPGRRGWLPVLCLYSRALCVTVWTSPSHGNRRAVEVQVLWDEPCMQVISLAKDFSIHRGSFVLTTGSLDFGDRNQFWL